MKAIFAGLLAALIIGHSLYQCAAAGPFLDLSMGAHVTDWPDECQCSDKQLSNENPIFVSRLGWQTDQYNFIFKSKIRGQLFWEHGSSAASSTDTGFDLVLISVRIE